MATEFGKYETDSNNPTKGDNITLFHVNVTNKRGEIVPQMNAQIIQRVQNLRLSGNFKVVDKRVLESIDRDHIT